MPFCHGTNTICALGDPNSLDMVLPGKMIDAKEEKVGLLQHCLSNVGQFVALHCIAMHCIALNCTAPLHCTALQYFSGAADGVPWRWPSPRTSLLDPSSPSCASVVYLHI